MTELSNTSGWQFPSYELYEFAPRKTDYCVCIPIINECERIRRELADIVQHHIADVADILLLDGGSTDGSTDPIFCDRRGYARCWSKPGKAS